MNGGLGPRTLVAGDLEATFLPDRGMLGASLRWRGVELLRRIDDLEAAAAKGSTAGIQGLDGSAIDHRRRTGRLLVKRGRAGTSSWIRPRRCCTWMVAVFRSTACRGRGWSGK